MFDLIIHGADVVDGSGAPRFRAEVAVADDRVVAVEPSLPLDQAKEIIDASGMVVSPGFIDMHAHSDLTLLREPQNDPKVRQGVTTEVLGQDGLSYAPSNETTLPVLKRQLRGWNGDMPEELTATSYGVGEFMALFDRSVANNVAYLVPHGSLRMMTVGLEERPPDGSELTQMRDLLSQGLAAGAVGLSTGLTYAPAMYADTAELRALCEVLAAGTEDYFFCPHHRNYGTHVLESFGECLKIARDTGCALHFAHTHMSFPQNKGRADELLDLFDREIARGVDVTFDSYPYLAGATYLHALLPGWFHEGGPEAIVERLQDRDALERARIALEIEGSDGYQGVPVDWNAIHVAGVARPSNRTAVGKSISQLAEETGVPPFEAYRRLILEDEMGTTCIAFFGHEENVRLIMQHPSHTGGSDGILVGDRPHPRGWGTFPRFLGPYTRELGTLTLEECVRHLTSTPARRLGLKRRGQVAAGYYADLVVFDPETVTDTATYEEPRQYPVGIRDVIVNGQFVIRGYEHTGATAGRWVRMGET